MSFPKHAKSQQCCDLYKTQKKGSHVVPSISTNSLTALFSPKLSHFMLHAPKLKKNSSLVPRFFIVAKKKLNKAPPWFPGCSMFPSKLLVPNLFPGRDLPLEHLPSLPTPPVPVPVHCQYQTSASTTTTSSLPNPCQHQCTASIKPVPVLLVLVHQTSASSTDSKSTSTVCATTDSTSNLVYQM